MIHTDGIQTIANAEVRELAAEIEPLVEEPVYPTAETVRTLDVLKNGATVIAVGGGDDTWRLVLCATTDGRPNGRREYVSWKLDSRGNCSYGDYRRSFIEAVDAFEHRG